MKITSQMIRSKARQSSLQSIQYLNLSHLEIYVLEKLNACSKLQALDVSHNYIESIPTTIEQCPQLWSFNVSCNKVQCLDGFVRFVAIGALNLSSNQLTWSELSKIRHLHILDLRLHGNPLLEKDPYYRIHVIDSLPNVWMLDGRLVTSAERIQVKTFFDDTAVSDRPVRHKLSSARGFVPSTQKNREVNGIFGEKVIHLMRRFPRQDIVNIDLDRRRLHYLAENIAQDIILHSTALLRKQPNTVIGEKFLVELLEARKVDALRCNMFIMLLLTSMEFKIPESLFNETMELMKLDKFGHVNAMEVLTLSKDTRALLTGVLLSAVKVERVEKETGGLYDKLYLSMNYLLTECIKSCSGTSSPLTGIYKQYRSLLAAEVVLLMCYVPSFAEYLQKEPGVMSLVTSATNDPHIIANVSTLKGSLVAQEIVESEQIKALGQFIQSAVMYKLANSSERSTMRKPQISQEHKIFSKRPLPKRPMSGPVFSSTYHTRGKTSPDRNPPRITSAKPKRAKQPDIGETVLTSPQCLARIVSLPQTDIALVLLEMIPVNGAMQSKGRSFEEHYAYIDTKELMWDIAKSYWRPRGTAGNRVTLHYIPDNVSSLPNNESDGAEITVCHHSTGGRTTPITMPALVGDCNDNRLTANTGTQELLFVSPRRPISVPSPSPVHSPRKAPNDTTNQINEAVALEKLALTEDNHGASNTNNNLSPETESHNTGCESRLTATPVARQPNKMAVIQIDADLPARPVTPLTFSKPVTLLGTTDCENVGTFQDGGETINTNNNRNESLGTPAGNAVVTDVPIAGTPPAGAPSASAPSADTASAESPLSGAPVSDTPAEKGLLEMGPLVTTAGADFEVYDDDSDEEELTDLVREDLIRDALSNTDASERNIAPTNSPDMRAVHSRASNQTTSRQPSATINSVYKMLRAEQSYRSSPMLSYRSQRGGYDDDPFSPHLRERSQDWDLRIHDPDGTPNVSVKWANLWLGGGRDLHYEEMKKRPSSAHVPGWKDGLKGTTRTRSAHTMRYVPSGKSKTAGHYRQESGSQCSTYSKQLAYQQYQFLPQQTAYRSSFLKTKENMRDKRQLTEMQRELAWSEYVKNAMSHRALN